MQDRANPYARERAIVIARQNPPFGVSPNEVAAVADVLDSIGDICPECPPGIDANTLPCKPCPPSRDRRAGPCYAERHRSD
jgi:hypothetical protein